MSDNKKTINCPACGKEMHKLYIPDEDVYIDICIEGCGGMFFDNRELDKFDELEENANAILSAIKNRTFEEVDKSEKRICPVCNVPMVKMGSGVTNVEIDVCNTCGAKFLDCGELLKIREAGENKVNINTAKIDLLYKENLYNILGKNADKKIKPSKGRQLFENIVIEYLNK